MPWQHLAKPSWCECGKCCKTAKEDENVCCGFKPCIRTEFKVYLRKELTETQLRESPKFSDCPGDLTDMGKLCRECYRKAFHYLKGKGWRSQDDDGDRGGGGGDDEKEKKETAYAALPSCIVWTIRRKYEEKGGKYTGFPPKWELLQKVVDARKTFRDDMESYKIVADVADPNGGLFAVLPMLEEEDYRKAHAALLDVAGVTSSFDDCRERWTKSINSGGELLPRFAFVACATAFEAFVHNTVRSSLDTVFSTRKISETEGKSWSSVFGKWLQSRKSDSEVWTIEEQKEENDFWNNFPPSLGVEPTPKQTVLSQVGEQWPRIHLYLAKKPTSQEAIGLVQEMMNKKKDTVFGTLGRSTTMESIQETFTRLAVEASNGNGARRRKKRQSASSQKSKTQVRSASETQIYCQSSVNSLSSDMSPSGCDEPYIPGSASQLSLSQKAQLPMDVTSTPVHVTGSPKKNADTFAAAIGYLIIRYAFEYNWQIWSDGTPHDVQCTNAESLSALSNLFYGMRCIFTHGTPEITLDVGAMRIDRTLQNMSDFIRIVPPQGITDDYCSEEKEKCEQYLRDVDTKARKDASQMKVDYNIFLTARSFYVYAAEIVGSVAACVTVKYSDAKLSERATTADKKEMQKIREMIADIHWKSAAAKTSPGFQTNLVNVDTTSSDPSVYRTEQTAFTKQHSLTPKFSSGSFQ